MNKHLKNGINIGSIRVAGGELSQEYHFNVTLYFDRMLKHQLEMELCESASPRVRLQHQLRTLPEDDLEFLSQFSGEIHIHISDIKAKTIKAAIDRQRIGWNQPRKKKRTK